MGIKKLVLQIGLLFIAITALFLAMSIQPVPAARADAKPKYVVIAWNDLGMHCYNKDFSDLAVLPPYNNVWAQVIRVDDPPQLVTTGITVIYEINGNSYSAGKTNF